jgi:CelD/BcsL family acetyltransferase involved in cellulose biosynthesis
MTRGPPHPRTSTRTVVAMQVTVVRPIELGISEEKQWREFQTTYAAAANPNYSLTFARAACRADPSGRVAIVEDGGAIRAFIPYTVGSRGIATTLGGGQVNTDGLISSNQPLDLRQVIRLAGLRGWIFSRAPVAQTPVDPYRYEGSYHRQLIRFVNLRGGYDAYRQALPRGVTKRISRTAGYRRALERDVGEVSFVWNDSDPASHSLLLKWKSAQYEYARKWASAPSSRSMVDELAASENEDCSGVTSVLYAGSKPISIVLSLKSGHILAPWMLAYDPEFSHFSPGTIEWIALFEEATARGVEIVDFGYGDKRYKQRFGTGSYMVGAGAVWASRLESGVRSAYRSVRFRDKQR